MVSDCRINIYAHSLQLKEYSEAEDALSEANMLNNLDPIIWAYLALICYKTGRKQEANQAVNFAVKVITSFILIR